MPNLARLFEDYIGAEKAYYKKTSIFPIMHLVGVLESKVKANPWLPASIFKAFEAAKNIALNDLLIVNIPTVSLPWAEAHAAEAAGIFGKDFWPYGVEENRPTWEQLLLYTYQQGIAHRHAKVEEIFPAGIDTQIIV